MKKVIIFTIIFTLTLTASVVFADINAVTPSTNDINRTNGWAHFDVTEVGIGYATFDFISTRNFYSCFEYRTDGDTSQVIAENGGNNYNTNITDGLYPYYCQNNNSRTETINASEYIEIRMVFGAETDERFDWTRVDVLFDRTAEITAPDPGEIVWGDVYFNAYLVDDDYDYVDWAVRRGTCAAGTNTVFGNVDGFDDPYSWAMNSEPYTYYFSAATNVSTWDQGMYCFIFNPREDSGESNIRLTREFYVDDDGVLNGDDLCPGTVPDELSKELGVNRWIWNGETWETAYPNGRGPDKEFTMEDTRGCSCFQILEWLNEYDPEMYGEMKGHYKFGCSQSVLEDFINIPKCED